VFWAEGSTWQQTPEHLVGRIWPRRNGLEPNNRMSNQINFIDEFWNRTSAGKMKVILKVGYFNFETFKETQSLFVAEGCPINSCFITANMSVRLTADVLLISEFRLEDRTVYLPKPAHQIWIAQHWESPKHNRIDPNAVRDLVNWTASYRRDSTVHVGYGHYGPVSTSSTAELYTLSISTM